MLVDNKFIYISLPRCGSTSFYYSCLVNDIKVQHITHSYSEHNSTIDFKSIDKSNIMNYIEHGHEPIVDLQKFFGNQYPIIAVKRQRHEKFYSLYKHVLFEFKRIGREDLYSIFSNFTLNELFFFKTEDLVSVTSRRNKIFDYLNHLNIINNKSISEISKSRNHDILYLINIINILLTPTSFWTNNDSDIIWFDFTQLDIMEKWISENLQKPFKLESVNSSKHMECTIKLNDSFIKKYNDIYDYFDLPKTQQSLI